MVNPQISADENNEMLIDPVNIYNTWSISIGSKWGKKNALRNTMDVKKQPKILMSVNKWAGRKVSDDDYHINFCPLPG